MDGGSIRSDVFLLYGVAVFGVKIFLNADSRVQKLNQGVGRRDCLPTLGLTASTLTASVLYEKIS